MISYSTFGLLAFGILVGGVLLGITLTKTDSPPITPDPTATEVNIDGNGAPTDPVVTEQPVVVPVSRTIDLSGQSLTKAPAYIFERTNTEALDLSNNRLSGSLQAEIRHLGVLRTLDLSNNQFTGVPAEIGQLRKLEVLNLSNNQLTGLPYELGNLSSLKILDLRGNNYATADLEIIKKNLPSTTQILTNN